MHYSYRNIVALRRVREMASSRRYITSKKSRHPPCCAFFDGRRWCEGTKLSERDCSKGVSNLGLMKYYLCVRHGRSKLRDVTRLKPLCHSNDTASAGRPVYLFSYYKQNRRYTSIATCISDSRLNLLVVTMSLIALEWSSSSHRQNACIRTRPISSM